MSRLDSAIRRLEAQRDCLAAAAGEIKDRSGPVLEIGLGNGRTYDHLKALLPDREIFVFERQVAAHPDSTPPPARLILGDLGDTLPKARERINAPACLAHADIGCGDPDIDARIASLLAHWLPELLSKDAVVLCDQPLSSEHLVEKALPASVAGGRYHYYAVAGNRA